MKIEEELQGCTDQQYEDLMQTFSEEFNSDDESWNNKGRELITSYLEGDVDGFCIALTGWDFRTILARAKIIEDTEHVWG